MQWPPTGQFTISPQAAITEPAWRHDFEKKKEFGRLLKEGLKPFEAAIKIFMHDNSAALWASNHWPNDETVKSAIVEQEEKSLKILDKEQLAAKVLAFADEKDRSGQFYINESPERLKALELYAKIAGHINNNPTTIVPVHNDNRRMEIVLVGGQDKYKEQSAMKTIEQETEVETLDLPVKLVN